MMIRSMRIIGYIFVFVASPATAQDKFSIEINQQMDAVLMEDNQGGPNDTLVVHTEKTAMNENPHSTAILKRWTQSAKLITAVCLLKCLLGR